MPNDPVFENGHISCSATDVHQYHSCFFFLLAQYGFSACKRFQGDVRHLQTSVLHTAKDVFDGGYLTDHDVEVGFQSSPVHAAWLPCVGLSVDLVFLRKDMDDLLSGHHDQFVDILFQGFDICILNDLVRIGTGDVVAVLEAADVLSGDAHGHLFDALLRLLFCELECGLYRLTGLHDVGHHASMNPK